MLRIPFRTPLGMPSDGAASVAASVPAIGRRRKLPWPAVAVAVVVVAGAGLFGYQRLTAKPAAAATTHTQPATRATVTSTVSSTGTVAASNTAKLSFGNTGTVTSVKVKVGDAVTKGQELASVDTTNLALAVTQAKSSLSTAEAGLAKVKAGSTAEDLKSAQASVDAANSKLNAMLAGGRPEEIAQAKASLDNAKASLSKLTSPSDADLKSAEQSVASAQAVLQKAQADLATVKAGPTSETVKNAQLAVDQAKNSLWSQQISRDGTCGRDQGYQCQAANASVASAETAVTVAQNNLVTAQAGPTADALATAEKNAASADAQLKTAQAQLVQLKAGGTPEGLAAARAAVTQAELALALKQKPYTDADILAQRQAVAAAEAALATKKTPYTDADVLTAQAAVDQAKASLESAQIDLTNATLTAPFDGIVSAVAVNAGEASASPAITIVDPKTLRLDVTVDESDIAKVQSGQKVTITFDSISGKSFVGEVTGVAPNATITSGVATYAVSISIADPGAIKAGMTGNASIVYGEQQNALVVPNRAVRTSGKNKVVDVLVNGQKQTRTVKVGIANDQVTEITEGLSEGEQVVITTTTTSTRTGGNAAGAVMGAGGPPPGQ